MKQPLYSDIYNQAIESYQKKDYTKALSFFKTLLVRKDAGDVQKAELLRRIADCHILLGGDETHLAMYDQALEYATKAQSEIIWILVSKASAYAHFEKFQEAIELYKQAVPLAQDPYDLQYLEEEIDDVIDRYTAFKEFGSLSVWKTKLLKKIDDLDEEMGKEEFELLVSDKRKLEA